MNGLVALVAAIGMIGFSLLVIIGCVVYSFFDDLPFMQNPFFGDILGAGAVIIFSALVILFVQKEHWFFDVSKHASQVLDGLTIVWVPALFGIWVLIARIWRTSQGVEGFSVLKKIFSGFLSVF